MFHPQVNTTCRALSCCEFVHSAIPFVKTGKRSRPTPVHFDRHQYCSSSCQDRDQRFRPVLRRIERMIHVFFLEFNDTTNTIPVISDQVVHDRYRNWRQIVALDRVDHPGTVTLLGDNFLSLRGRLAFLSFDSCTTVLTVFAALMAYLCKDLDPSIEIHEAHVDNVLSDQEVYILVLRENEEARNLSVADVHSMFRITATKEDNNVIPAEPAQLNGTGIYYDTTAAQYGRVAGLQDAKIYHHYHPDSKTVYYTSLGCYRRMRHLPDVDPDDARDARHHIRALSQEAYIRTMNNVVHDEIEGIGGCAHLLAMTSANFEAAYTKIAARVQSALHSIAVELYELYLNLPQGMALESMDNADRYRAVKDRCMGAGHAACVRALEERAPETWAYIDGRMRYL